MQARHNCRAFFARLPCNRCRARCFCHAFLVFPYSLRRTPTMQESLKGYVKGWGPAVRRRRVVLAKQNGRCLICGILVFDSRELRQQGCTHIRVKRVWVTWTSPQGVPQRGKVATVDHIVSKQRWAREQRPGSPHVISNLAVLCSSCHRTKTIWENIVRRRRVKGVCQKCQRPCSSRRKKCLLCRLGKGHPLYSRLVQQLKNPLET